MVLNMTEEKLLYKFSRHRGLKIRHGAKQARSTKVLRKTEQGCDSPIARGYQCYPEHKTIATRKLVAGTPPATANNTTTTKKLA